MSVEVVVKPEIKVKGYVKDGVACVVLSMDTAAGPVSLTGYFPLYQAAKMLSAYAKNKGIKIGDIAVEGETESGGFLSKFKKLSKKIALAKALAPVLKTAQQIQKNPVLARAVGLTTVVVPGLATQAKALQSATNLVSDAMRGNLKAKDALKKIKSLAAQGLPQGVEAMKLVKKVASEAALKTPFDALKGAPAELRNLAAQVTAPVNQALAALPPPARAAAEAALRASPAGTPLAVLQSVASGADRAAWEYQQYARNAANPPLNSSPVFAL